MHPHSCRQQTQLQLTVGGSSLVAAGPGDASAGRASCCVSIGSACEPHWQVRDQHTPLRIHVSCKCYTCSIVWACWGPQQAVQPHGYVVILVWSLCPGGASAAAVPDQQLGLEHAWSGQGRCLNSSKMRCCAAQHGCDGPAVAGRVYSPCCYCINTACYRDK